MAIEILKFEVLLSYIRQGLSYTETWPYVKCFHTWSLTRKRAFRFHIIRPLRGMGTCRSGTLSSISYEGDNFFVTTCLFPRNTGKGGSFCFFLFLFVFLHIKGPFWTEVFSKRKEFASKGSKFFPFRVDRFLEEGKSIWQSCPQSFISLCYINQGRVSEQAMQLAELLFSQSELGHSR